MCDANDAAVLVDGGDRTVDFRRLHTAPVGVALFAQYQHMTEIRRPFDACHTDKPFALECGIKLPQAGGGVVVAQRDGGKAARMGGFNQTGYGEITVAVFGVGVQFNRIPLHRASSLRCAVCRSTPVR